MQQNTMAMQKVQHEWLKENNVKITITIWWKQLFDKYACVFVKKYWLTIQ